MWQNSPQFYVAPKQSPYSWLNCISYRKSTFTHFFIVRIKWYVLGAADYAFGHNVLKTSLTHLNPNCKNRLVSTFCNWTSDTSMSYLSRRKDYYCAHHTFGFVVCKIISTYDLGICSLDLPRRSRGTISKYRAIPSTFHSTVIPTSKFTYSDRLTMVSIMFCIRHTEPAQLRTSTHLLLSWQVTINYCR